MKRFEVFISSTIDDLKDARGSVAEELIATEIFSATIVERIPAVEKNSRQVCYEGIDSADALVLILANRYGFIPVDNNPDRLSVTHLEYREAKRINVPVFTFVRENAEPDPRLVSFIKELSDFDAGVFRKTWKSTEDLKHEVRRALLYWLAKRARENDRHVDKEQVASARKRYPDFGQFRLSVDTSELDKIQTTRSDVNYWIDELLERLGAECEKRLLPLPLVALPSESDDPHVAVFLRAYPADQPGRVLVTLLPGIAVRTKYEEVHVPEPIRLEAAVSPNGAAFVAQAALALVHLTARDCEASITQLLSVAGSRNATAYSQTRLLATAAYLSAACQGQSIFDVGRRILQAKFMDSDLASTGVMALKVAQVRFDQAGAHYARSRASELAIAILTRALRQENVRPDTLYNLAREFFTYSHKASLDFFSQLLQVDPSYDDRWYVHRDLGIIYYSEGHYREAAYHYDLACARRTTDSELLRFAGDAFYYQGNWARALIRYQKAISIEPVEEYFLDRKIAFARVRTSNGEEIDRRFRRKWKAAGRLSSIGVKLAEKGQSRLARPVFVLAKRICAMNSTANSWLALYANRKAQYELAASLLNYALCMSPENALVRLNLVMNLVFLNSGQLADEARTHLRIAIFHGGPELREHFRLRLVNTPNSEELCSAFDEIAASVMHEHQRWRERRQKVLAPERFGNVIHFECRE